MSCTPCQNPVDCFKLKQCHAGCADGGGGEADTPRKSNQTKSSIKVQGISASRPSNEYKETKSLTEATKASRGKVSRCSFLGEKKVLLVIGVLVAIVTLITVLALMTPMMAKIKGDPSHEASPHPNSTTRMLGLLEDLGIFDIKLTRPDGTCVPHKETCAETSECCLEQDKCLDSQCIKCIKQDKTCQKSSDCCGKLKCVDEVCSTCTPHAGFCEQSSDCCRSNDICIFGSCQKCRKVGETCVKHADCCGSETRCVDFFCKETDKTGYRD